MFPSSLLNTTNFSVLEVKPIKKSPQVLDDEHSQTGWWQFKYVFYVHPETWGRWFPFWRAYFFNGGWLKPPTSWSLNCFFPLPGLNKISTHPWMMKIPKSSKLRFLVKETLWTRRSFIDRSEAGMGGGSSNAATAFFGWEISGEISDLSNEKRAPGWLGYIGDEILPRLYRDYNKAL